MRALALTGIAANLLTGGDGGSPQDTQKRRPGITLER